MPGDQRIILFMVVLLLLLTGFVVYQNPQIALGSRGAIILAVLVMLSLTMVSVQHYFVKPTNAVISSVSMLLVLSPTHALINQMLPWYQLFAVYNALVLVLGLTALVRLRPERALSADFNHSTLSLNNVSQMLGSKFLLWPMLVLLCALFYYETRANQFIALAAYGLLVMLVDPEKISAARARRRQQADTAGQAVAPVTPPAEPEPAQEIMSAAVIASTQPGIAEITGSCSPNTLLASMREGETPPARFEVLGLLLESDGQTGWKTGIALESHAEGSTRVLKILLDDSFVELKLKTRRVPSAMPGHVYRLQPKHSLYLFERLVGTVGEKSTADKIQIVAAPRLSVALGELLHVTQDDVDVFYQVLYAPKNNGEGQPAASGLALQTGCWNEHSNRFETTDWVAPVNSPIYKSDECVKTVFEPPEYPVGTLPGTDYPVIIHCEAALADNLAVLGIDEDGKRAFVSSLLNQAAANASRVICFDADGGMCVKADSPMPVLIDAAHQQKLTDAAELMCNELEKPLGAQDSEALLLQETVLRGGFMACITAFLKGEHSFAQFVLPPALAPACTQLYVRWFFNTLVELAQSNKFEATRMCVLLGSASRMLARIAAPDDAVLDARSLVDSIQQLASMDASYGLGLVVLDERLSELSGPIIRLCQSVISFQQASLGDREYFSQVMGQGFMSVLTHLKPRQAVAAGKAFNCDVPLLFEVA